MYEDIKTACLYVRFSSHNQTEQSIEGQTRVCQEFCQRHNIKIVEIYADRATSASKNTEKRVSFLKMIKDSEKGLFDAVVVYKLDRFARSRYDSATYKYRLKKNGVQLISATENITNSPEGIILESVLEGMAEFYSAELSQKINRGMRESAYKHNSIGGALPLGYKTVDKKLVIDEKTAPIVREAFTMYAEGHSVAEICRIFNARGYKTSKGTEFGKNSFSKIFRNERYIGTYTYHDYRAEDTIPAIIDRDLWDRVQLRLKKVKNSPGRNKAKRVYLLSGKLFCGHCGESMNGNCNGNKYAFYECYGKKSKYNGCQKRNLRKEYIERLVAQDALSLLTDENIEHLATVACERNDYEIETGSPIPVIKDRIHQTEVSINNLTKAIETGATPDALVKRMVELEREKKDLSAQLKKEEELVVPLEKEQVIFWLEKFKDGDIEDEEFCRLLIDLFVNSVTAWDEDDDMLKVTIAYNLTSLPTKTYRLTKDGTLSDFADNSPAKLVRPVCLTASTVLVLGILFAVMFMMIPSLRESGEEFVQNIPLYVEEIGRWWTGVVQFAAKYNIVLPEYTIDSDLLIEKLTALISDEGSGILTVTWGAATSVLSVLVDVLLGLVFALYLLAKKEVVAAHLKKLVVTVLPQKKAQRLLSIASLTNQTFTNFVSGQLTEAVIIGVLCFFGMLILGIPYAGAVSAFVAVTALVPIFGAWIGGGLGAFLILLAEPGKALWFILFLLVLQQVEGNLIYPKVVGKSVGLPGLLVLMAVTIGGEAFGILGMLFSVPVCAVLYSLYLEFMKKASARH